MRGDERLKTGYRMQEERTTTTDGSGLAGCTFYTASSNPYPCRLFLRQAWEGASQRKRFLEGEVRNMRNKAKGTVSSITSTKISGKGRIRVHFSVQIRAHEGFQYLVPYIRE